MIKQHIPRILILATFAAMANHGAMAQNKLVVLPPSDDQAGPGFPGPRVEARLAQVVRAGEGEDRGRHEAGSRHRVHPPISERVPRPLLILSSAHEEKTIGQLREDLAVMSRILDKNVREVASASSFQAMGIEVLSFPGSKPTRNMYIDGYGVIFTLRVNMPLVAPENDGAAAKEEKEPVDTAWEEAKNEVFGGARRRGRGQGPRQQEYDARSVEDLKQTLIESLRNASNIRNLGESDWVTIVVTGQPSSAEGRGEFHNALRFEFKEVFLWREEGLEDESTTMVIRAKKSDIDEFAQKKGKDFNAFGKKVSVTLY